MPIPRAAASPSPLPTCPPALPPSRSVTRQLPTLHLGARISGIANVAVDTPQARVVALATGGLTGCLMSIANATAPLTGAIVGACLGEVYLRIARHDAERERAHQQRWDMLHSTAALRDLALKFALDHADAARVRTIHDHLHGLMEQMIDGYRAHAASVGLPVGPALETGLKAFFMEACVDRPPCVITCKETGHRYIAAVAPSQLERLQREINGEGRPPGAVLRNLRTTFFHVDPAGPDPGVCGQTVDRHGGQWQLRPARPVPLTAKDAAPTRSVADTALPSQDWMRQPAPMVQVRHRRLPTGREAGPTTMPTLGASGRAKRAQSVDVQRGATLKEQCARLPPDSSTLKRIERVEQDLAAGRIQGHVVKQDGHVFIATDANIEGLSGRSRWRLLCRQVESGYELVGIADYHDTPFRWWTG